MAVSNKGRLINFINGITGVSAGGQAVINFATNTRYHRNKLQCTAVNYTGGNVVTSGGGFTGTITGAATTGGTGTGLTLNLTVVNGAITAVAINAAGTGYTALDSVVPTDATGVGAKVTVATVTAGVPQTLTLVSGGTPSAMAPQQLIPSLRQLVNGVNMRDITPANILNIQTANGILPSLGELPLDYTEPWRNINNHNEVNSWDLFGQNTFQVQIGIASNVVSPGIVGVSEFDYLRNVNVDGGKLVPFLQPVAQHQFSYNGIAGRNDINTLPFSFPISRMWIYGSTAGAITQLEIYQDNNKVFEATTEQMKEMYQDYGFQFGRANYFNQNYATVNNLKAQFNPVTYFDAAFIADPDQRIYKALQCANSLVVRVYSSIAQTITIVQETLPGSYAS